MPITTDKAALYPADWFEITQEVKLRAGWCCEGSPAYPDCRRAHGEPIDPARPTKRVVLTVGHLNHNPADNGSVGKRDNLKAWCQRCHVTYDSELHALSSLTRKARALRAAGQQQLPSPDDKGLLF